MTNKNRRFTRVIYSLACLQLLLSSCGGSICPADEVIEIPILTIREARNAVTGAEIPQVVLAGIHIQGQLQSGSDMELVLGSNAENATLEGDQLRCTLACGFGGDYGEWQFNVSAPGFASRMVNIPDVRYTAFDRDGCTNTATRGTIISLTLDPMS
jgi:hypothetical protein